MGKYSVHRVDGNAAVIIEALEAAGAEVEKIGRPVDLLVSIDGVCGVADVKTLTGKIRASQALFFLRFKGPWAVLRTVVDAETFVERLMMIAESGVNE